MKMTKFEKNLRKRSNQMHTFLHVSEFISCDGVRHTSSSLNAARWRIMHKA